MGRLTDKRRAFVTYYLRTFNATEAARLANYAHPNKLGPRLIHEPTIRSAVRKRMTELAMSAEEVVARLAMIAKGGKYGENDVSIRDALRALELLGKTHKLFTEKLIVSWQEELRAAGVPESEVFENMVQKAFEELED